MSKGIGWYILKVLSNINFAESEERHFGVGIGKRKKAS